MLDYRDQREVEIGGRRATLVLGNGSLALEVVVIDFNGRPRMPELRDIFKERSGRRAAPVLVVSVWGDKRATIYGPTEHNALELLDLPASQVEKVCDRALNAPDRHAAIRTLHQLLPQLAIKIPGIRNSGLLAMQELEHGVPRRSDWKGACSKGQAVLKARGRELIRMLDFTTEDLPGPAILLYSKDRKTAVAVLLDRPDEVDLASDRFDGSSPISYALSRADREHLTT